MPYQQLEELGARRHEKVALYLTFENAIGLIAGALPAYIVLASAPGVLRIVLTLLTGALGLIMTLDAAGLPLYQRLLWRMRGYVRMRTGGTTITPEALSGTPHRVASGQARALRVGGTIRIAGAPVLSLSPASGNRLAGTARCLRPNPVPDEEVPA